MCVLSLHAIFFTTQGFIAAMMAPVVHLLRSMGVQ